MTLPAYLSGVGVMGRRHLRGLVMAGFDVMVSDPSLEALERAREDLRTGGLPAERMRITDGPEGRFAVAVFAETACSRLENFRRFLSSSRAERVLLEKPLSADPVEFDVFLTLAREHGMAEATQVNLIRRNWPHVQTLAALCAKEPRFAMTVNAGAVGLAAIGIHVLDTFLFLAGEEMPTIVWCSLSKEAIASGRGAQFRDYGGQFVLQGSRGTLMASLDATSSADAVMTVRGEHFMAQIDYAIGRRWKLACRQADSALPVYRCGGDYSIVEDGQAVVPTMDELTMSWALQRLQMSPLGQACAAHRLLIDILIAGGARPPFSFT